MQIKRFFNIILLSVPLVFLTGCMKKKVKADDKKSVMHAGAGIPLSGLKKSAKSHDKDLEEFLLDDSQDIKAKKVTLSMDSHDEHREITWQDDTQQVTGFQPVLFDFDRFSIRADQAPVVARDAKLAKNEVAQGKGLRVEGHSDKHYISETYNLAVSQKRAHTVANVLAESGIDKDVIKPVGYGANKPAVDLPGKIQENRRVEIVTLIG